MRSIPLTGLLLMTSCTEPNPYLGICGNGLVEPDFDEECEPGLDDGCSDLCRLPACGDGIVQEGEACDLGADNLDTGICTSACQEARCGDGFVHAGTEACDDGDANKQSYDGQGGCSTTCEALPTCGDGVTTPPFETCDDGNQTDDDGCSALCQKPVCGDGIQDPGEACDDGNKSNTDACLSDCTLASCGDGFVHEGTEECDDGNEDRLRLRPRALLP